MVTSAPSVIPALSVISTKGPTPRVIDPPSVWSTRRTSPSGVPRTSWATVNRPSAAARPASGPGAGRVTPAREALNPATQSVVRKRGTVGSPPGGSRPVVVGGRYVHGCGGRRRVDRDPGAVALRLGDGDDAARG